MEYEIELKLSTTVQAGMFIESQLLPKIAARVEQRELQLTNSYFYTKQRDFRKNGMGLRIRGSGHEYEQTIKTAGKGVAGLQQRPEYNVALGKNLQQVPKVPDLSLFPAEVWPAGFDPKYAQAQLHCLFATHFSRTVYLLTFDEQSQIELVWDRGEVKANEQQDEINEIELELKQGNVSNIFSLARQLATIMPLKVGLLSKAARGYRLLQAASKPDVVSVKPLASLSEDDINAASPAVLNDYLAKQLTSWQRLINQFEESPTEYVFAQLQTQWQQLNLLLNKCFQTNQQHSQQLKTDTQNFNHQWQALLLNISDSNEKAEWPEAVALLNGSTALLLQLAIMQYLVH